MSFANTGIKHATIAMAYVGARAVHAGIRTLAVFTKDIPISSSGLFESALSRSVAKVALALALADSFMLSDLPRPKPPQGWKQKASSSPPLVAGASPGTGRVAHLPPPEQ